MRNYTPEEYIKLVENIEMKEFTNYMKDEVSFIKSITDCNTKTFIELGAGYGRIIPYIINFIQKYIGVEINPQMYNELSRRSQLFKNVYTIQGDITHINVLLKKSQFSSPVIMILQNTLGALEGDIDVILFSLKKFFKINKGELIISALKTQKLPSFGLEFYQSIEPICGKYDPIKSNLDKGLFVSNTNYQSKWWTKNELIDILNFLEYKSYNISETDNAFFIKAKF